MGDWVPFRRYLNSDFDLEDLMAGGFGKLAGGPSFLMMAYAAALKTQGMVPRLLAPRTSRWWDSRPAPDTLASLVIGNSYVVSEVFEETLVPVEPGDKSSGEQT